MTISSHISLFISIAIVFAVASFNRLFKPDRWYEKLEKPKWNPPKWVFGVAWPLLYLLMGISLWLIWQDEPSPLRSLAMTFFILQLVFNSIWSFLFFGQHKIGLALIDIILLWATIILTAHFSYQLQPIIGFLFIPYVLWITFATFLNGKIWRLNK